MALNSGLPSDEKGNQYSLLDEAYRFGCAKKEFFPEG